jgi:hypothetical protein
MNSTASSAAPSDASITTVLSELSLNITANRVPYGNGSSGLTSSSTFIFDGTNLGIGTATPHAPLQFASATANRKIVLYEGTNNDHQNYSLGVNSATFRYQTPSTGDDHVFYAATSSSASDELFRIKGTKIVQTLAGGGMQFGNSTASYTPSTLDYHEVGTFTVNFSGVATISNKTVNFIRFGKIVFLFFSGSQPAATAASSFTTGSGAIPARLRPATGLDYDGNCWVMDSSAWQTTPGRAIALSDGTIQIYKLNTTTNFTNSGNAGFSNVYMYYMTA